MEFWYPEELPYTPKIFSDDFNSFYLKTMNNVTLMYSVEECVLAECYQSDFDKALPAPMEIIPKSFSHGTIIATPVYGRRGIVHPLWILYGNSATEYTQRSLQYHKYTSYKLKKTLLRYIAQKKCS